MRKRKNESGKLALNPQRMKLAAAIMIFKNHKIVVNCDMPTNYSISLNSVKLFLFCKAFNKNRYVIHYVRNDKVMKFNNYSIKLS